MRDKARGKFRRAELGNKSTFADFSEEQIRRGLLRERERTIVLSYTKKGLLTFKVGQFI